MLLQFALSEVLAYYVFRLRELIYAVEEFCISLWTIFILNFTNSELTPIALVRVFARARNFR